MTSPSNGHNCEGVLIRLGFDESCLDQPTSTSDRSLNMPSLQAAVLKTAVWKVTKIEPAIPFVTEGSHYLSFQPPLTIENARRIQEIFQGITE